MFLKVQFGYLKALGSGRAGADDQRAGRGGGAALTVNLPGYLPRPAWRWWLPTSTPARKSPLLLGAANVFSFWLVGVLSVGLAKLAGVPFLRAAWFVFAVWVIQESLLVLVAGVLGQFFGSFEDDWTIRGLVQLASSACWAQLKPRSNPNSSYGTNSVDSGTATGSSAAARHVARGPVAECVRHPGRCLSGSEDRQRLDGQLAGAGADPHRGKLGGGAG